MGTRRCRVRESAQGTRPLAQPPRLRSSRPPSAARRAAAPSGRGPRHCGCQGLPHRRGGGDLPRRVRTGGASWPRCPRAAATVTVHSAGARADASERWRQCGGPATGAGPSRPRGDNHSRCGSKAAAPAPNTNASVQRARPRPPGCSCPEPGTLALGGDGVTAFGPAPWLLDTVPHCSEPPAAGAATAFLRAAGLEPEVLQPGEVSRVRPVADRGRQGNECAGLGSLHATHYPICPPPHCAGVVAQTGRELGCERRGSTRKLRQRCLAPSALIRSHATLGTCLCVCVYLGICAWVWVERKGVSRGRSRALWRRGGCQWCGNEEGTACINHITACRRVTRPLPHTLRFAPHTHATRCARRRSPTGARWRPSRGRLQRLRRLQALPRAGRARWDGAPIEPSPPSHLASRRTRATWRSSSPSARAPTSAPRSPTAGAAHRRRRRRSAVTWRGRATF